MHLMYRAAHLPLTGLIVFIALASVADARHYRERVSADSRFSAQTGSAVGAMINQLVRDCAQEAVELRNFPVQSIARTITADDGQDTALEAIGRLANQTADTLAANCPQDVSNDPVERVHAIEHGLDAVGAALNAVQPPTQALYNSLKEDQKARLLPKSLVAIGDTSRAVRASGLRMPDAPRQPAQQWSCEHWGAELRAWPINQVEKAVQVGARQRGAFYELAAAFQHAADALADACPQEPALTPISRMAQLRKRLDAVRQSIAIIGPALTRFNDMLDGGQRMQFSDAL